VTDPVRRAIDHRVPWAAHDEFFFHQAFGSGPALTQGWKLHVSATPLSAVEVLEAMLDVLLAAGARFKVVKSIELLRSLNAGQFGLTQIGKFITVYPSDDAGAVAAITWRPRPASPIRSRPPAPMWRGRRARNCSTIYTNWKVSWNGQTEWDAINASTYRSDDLRFGDFDGDGRTDLFTVRNREWSWSSGGRTRWAKLNDDLAPLSDVVLGDFNGDGRCDVAFRQR
jgi:hypothetical protein